MYQASVQALKSKIWDGPCSRGAYCLWYIFSWASQKSHVQHCTDVWPDLLDHPPKGLEMDTLVI